MEGVTKGMQERIRKVLKLKPGDYYNINELRRDLTRVFNKFDFENVEPKLDFPKPNRVDIHLLVTPKADKRRTAEDSALRANN